MIDYMRAITVLESMYIFYDDYLTQATHEEVKEAIFLAVELLYKARSEELDKKITSSTKIQADNFFGYDDNQFFTRDDEIDYIEIPLCDKYGAMNAFRCYIDGNQLEVDWKVDDYEGTAKAVIDFRKIRKPSDLGKYLPIIEQQIDDELAIN